MRGTRIKHGVYLHVLMGSERFFADEIQKRWFLDMLQDRLRIRPVHIFAFCMTDESIFFVSELDDAAYSLAVIEDTAREYACRCRDSLSWFGNREMLFFHAILKELSTRGAILRCCRSLHRMPLKEGYVTKPEYYFWSSYLTYTGQYEWQMIDRNWKKRNNFYIFS